MHQALSWMRLIPLLCSVVETSLAVCSGWPRAHYIDQARLASNSPISFCFCFPNASIKGLPLHVGLWCSWFLRKALTL